MTRDDLVWRKVARMWLSPSDADNAKQILISLEAGANHSESRRVQLAVLKLSDGSLAELQRLTDIAKADYRDVLAWAEYPEQTRTLLVDAERLGDEQRRELQEIKRRDRKQYEDSTSSTSETNRALLRAVLTSPGPRYTGAAAGVPGMSSRGSVVAAAPTSRSRDERALRAGRPRNW